MRKCYKEKNKMVKSKEWLRAGASGKASLKRWQLRKFLKEVGEGAMGLSEQREWQVQKLWAEILLTRFKKQEDSVAGVAGAKGGRARRWSHGSGESRSYSTAAFSMKRHGTVLRLSCDLIFESFLRLLEKTEGRRARGWQGGRVGGGGIR